jgi:hypothetical protein
MTRGHSWSIQAPLKRRSNLCPSLQLPGIGEACERTRHDPTRCSAPGLLPFLAPFRTYIGTHSTGFQQRLHKQAPLPACLPQPSCRTTETRETPKARPPLLPRLAPKTRNPPSPGERQRHAPPLSAEGVNQPHPAPKDPSAVRLSEGAPKARVWFRENHRAIRAANRQVLARAPERFLCSFLWRAKERRPARQRRWPPRAKAPAQHEDAPRSSTHNSTRKKQPARAAAPAQQIKPRAAQMRKRPELG